MEISQCPSHIHIMATDPNFTGFLLVSSLVSHHVNASLSGERRTIDWLAIARTADEAEELVRYYVSEWDIEVIDRGDAILAEARSKGIQHGHADKRDR